MSPALIALAGLGIGWLTGIVYAGCKPGGSLELHFRRMDLERENAHLRELLGLEVNASMARHPAGRHRRDVIDVRHRYNTIRGEQGHRYNPGGMV